MTAIEVGPVPRELLMGIATAAPIFPAGAQISPFARAASADPYAEHIAVSITALRHPGGVDQGDQTAGSSSRSSRFARRAD
ncbi:hypothetical protein [Methylorubrum populi]|uniref:hypothetical protein n=1 Tax=Methylorubrum populi TaxID=223967 RepID=UPI00139062D8|nr:hypothetical protein [Methylorubrum populi]